MFTPRPGALIKLSYYLVKCHQLYNYLEKERNKKPFYRAKRIKKFWNKVQDYKEKKWITVHYIDFGLRGAESNLPFCEVF